MVTLFSRKKGRASHQTKQKNIDDTSKWCTPTPSLKLPWISSNKNTPSTIHQLKYLKDVSGFIDKFLAPHFKWLEPLSKSYEKSHKNHRRGCYLYFFPKKAIYDTLNECETTSKGANYRLLTQCIKEGAVWTLFSTVTRTSRKHCVQCTRKKVRFLK